MSNGSERMPEHPTMRVEGKLDFGPHTQVRLTEWIENVPVKDVDGHIVGRAKVGDNGVIQAVIDDTDRTREIFDLLRTRVSTGLSIDAYNVPAVPVTPDISYSEEVRRRFEAANSPHTKKEEN